jgi:chemotaxis protein CheD
MNHFLLPGDRPGADLAQSGGAMRYGAYSMELLVNGLLREGAERHRLRAKLFGGARMLKGLTDVGNANAEFAERFLLQEGITVVGGSLRGDRGRRIQFWPTTGRAQQIEFGNNDDAIFKTESRIALAPPKAAGSLELF